MAQVAAKANAGITSRIFYLHRFNFQKALYIAVSQTVFRTTNKKGIDDQSLATEKKNRFYSDYLVSFADCEFHSLIASCKSFLNEGFCR